MKSILRAIVRALGWVFFVVVLFLGWLRVIDFAYHVGGRRECECDCGEHSSHIGHMGDPNGGL
jgi:hypothetical protein